MPGLIAPDQIEIKAKPETRHKKPPDYNSMERVGRFLMLGAGRQSSILAELIVEGMIEPVDAVIFADTGDEPSWVYEQVWYLAGRLASVNIPLHIVVAYPDETIITMATKGHRFAAMPVYTGGKGEKTGILKRQCTNEYKIVPSQGFIRQWLLERGHAYLRSDGARVVRRGVYVDVLFGFGVDEQYRMTFHKRVANWNRRVYPLFELEWSTEDGVQWLRDNGFPVPKKSSCRVCPYHSDEYWLDLKVNYPDDFEHACQFDEWLRGGDAAAQKVIGGVEKLLWLHETCLPLREVDFEARIAERKARLEALRLKDPTAWQKELFVMDSRTCGTDGGFSCDS